jgi:ribosomal protein L37E
MSEKCYVVSCPDCGAILYRKKKSDTCRCGYCRTIFSVDEWNRQDWIGKVEEEILKEGI